MIIAIDFDGTIARSDYPHITGEMPLAGETLRKLKSDGHYLILWTCRTGKELLDAINWMLAKGIPFDRVNDHEPGNVERYGAGGPKVYAHCYVDDKNVGGFPGWPETYRMIAEMDAEWRKGSSGIK